MTATARARSSRANGPALAKSAGFGLEYAPSYDPPFVGADGVVWQLAYGGEEIFMEVFDDERAHYVEFVLSAPERSATLWEQTLSRPWEARWFMYDRALHMAHPMRSQTLQWSLA